MLNSLEFVKVASVSEILKRSFNTKIFSLNRIKYEELWEDALKYIKGVYNSKNEEFNSSSPFAQLLSVILHLGRMIIYYIEDAINGTNIKTAWRPDQIRGLATLTGHDPGRAVASRAAVRITYNGSSDDLNNRIVYIPNKLKMTNILNGQNYVLMLGSNSVRMTFAPGNYINGNIVQGKVTIQSATSDGGTMQSFNFAERNYTTIDQYFVYVYVNDVPWKTVNSFIDMGMDEEACVVKTGQSGGIDVFFGNGDFGKVPEAGATIKCEYIVTSGNAGNFDKEIMNSSNYWQFDDKGFLTDGSMVDLTQYLNLECLTDCILGSYYEDITLTQRIAPYCSRSFVLATPTNYKYFFEKMRMFSVVDVIQGYNTADDKDAELNYQNAQYRYAEIKNQYMNAINLYGKNSDMASQLSEQLATASKKLKQTLTVLENSKMDDNTVYLFLIPDISSRIGQTDNYFTCDESKSFGLTADEKYNILNLIDMSGQGIISVEHRIMRVLYPRFAINIAVRLWEGYDYESVYTSIITKLSAYFIASNRRDRIPVSDIVALCEDISGIDSVSVYFDADPNNKNLYGNDFNGIDEYGDVVLERTIVNRLGKNVVVRDLFPLFRGGFTNENGIEYSDIQQRDVISAVNVTVTGYSSNNLQTNLENKISSGR